MAERFEGRVVRYTLGGSSCRSSDRLLSHLLDQTLGVTAHAIDAETRTLVAYVDDAHAEDAHIVRALVASGMYPVEARDLGVTEEGRTDVC